MSTANYSPRISPLAEFVLLAEFDIDKGSSLSCQYPVPTGADPATLAEWMLPDGAHLRQEDCSYFILNRTTPGKIVPNESISLEQLQSHPLEVRIQAIAYTKPQKVWRLSYEHGETIVALRTGSHIVVIDPDLNERVWSVSYSSCEYWDELTVCFRKLNPPLVLRFRSADDRVYFMRFVHESAQVLPTHRVTQEDLPPLPTLEEPLLYVINMVSMKIISGARRSARVKAMAIASRHPWVHVFKPLLVLALDKYFISPSEKVISDLFSVLNGVDARSIPILTLPERKVLRTLLRNNIPHHGANFEQTAMLLKHYDPTDEPLELLDYIVDPAIIVNFNGHALPVKVPLASLPSEFGDFSFIKLLSIFGAPGLSNPQLPLKWRNELPYCWHPHLDCGALTHPLIVLIFALLTEKRVLFLGYGKPSSEVSSCVLACTAIASGGGLIPDAISRSFPYVGLASVDMLLKVPGYIAGVTNPVFEEQAAWWDVLCNLNTGKITISPRLISNENSSDVVKDRSFDSAQAVSEEDGMLVQEILVGLQKNIDEMHLRQLVYNFVERFIQVCTPPLDINISAGGKGTSVPGLTRTPQVMPSISGSIVAPVPRIPMQWRARAEAWQGTQSIKNLCQSRRYMARKTMFPQYDIKSTLTEMTSAPSLLPAAVTGVVSAATTTPNSATDRVVSNFCIMDYLVQEASDDELVEILSYLPTTDGSCLPFSIGLFHERPEVRAAAAHIIQRLFLQKIGEQYINPYVKLAVARLLQNTFSTDLETFGMHESAHTTAQSVSATFGEEGEMVYLDEDVIDEGGFDSEDSDPDLHGSESANDTHSSSMGLAMSLSSSSRRTSNGPHSNTLRDGNGGGEAEGWPAATRQPRGRRQRSTGGGGDGYDKYVGIDACIGHREWRIAAY
ncbi:hypothetical protein BASA62_001133 [Batrachochytrium salamandrivorans]|nr:hypothetical protein BASA62_001133 [Batrachochytrium salamandrivorans]